MALLTVIILIFTLIQLTISLINLIFERNLPESGKQPGELVSVLIPARNEEKNIANILNDLIEQDHRNIEVIIFNDQSEDNTAAIVNRFVNKDKRINLINSEGLPEGWLGKNHACHILSEHARGEYLLFLDADVRAGKKLISCAIEYARKHNTGLISIFPKQIIKSVGEWITVPNMNFILVSLLPLILVRICKYPSLSAANGQFMFFKAMAYKSTEPHKIMKGHKVEDIAIAKFYKENNIKIACLLGDKKITCRMYEGFNDSVNGFSKNVIAFFGDSFLLALLFWFITTFGFVVIYFALPKTVFALYIASFLLIRIIVSIASRQNTFYNLVFLIPLQISLGIFIYKAFIYKHFNKFQWKGRSIN
ncbi:MAG: glycosyltransferase family 2 protein [Bacteroidales bacterium]|nr:glycosyltransferase family 2 protein [Bacteroidales bacterium]